MAHRLSTIKDVDRIIVLSNGVVVEEGTHDVLMELKGHYYGLVIRQTNATTIEGTHDHDLPNLTEEKQQERRVSGYRDNNLDEDTEVCHI